MATLSSGDESVEVADGKRLVLAIEQDLEIGIMHRCGGNAMCTTCRVVFTAGEPTTMTEAELDLLEGRDLLGEARLSCQIRAEGEMTFTPVLTKESEGTDNPGDTPDPDIQPPPVWTERP
ncbi:MAG: Ferredoxin [uncultured Acidimicrobiales bacterium]|uniref:Ferredoxin n=1 Tax=uncultured Acidimicrobiales bacterium TaxID=310071 RepID=A0A6J4H2C3_9ACTN|nr:MAG: Ferredoxin [uncultured Acidimicrobiales bacterium]